MSDIVRVPGEDLGWATPIAALAIGCACSATAVALVNAPSPTARAVEVEASPTHRLAPAAVPSAAPVALSAPLPVASAALVAAPVCAPLAVVFEYAHENVPTAEGPRIGRLAHWLAEHPATSVVLQGHADSRGSEDENLGLSKRRARNVANALAGKGVDRRRMTASGFGSYQPVEGVPEEAAANRRVVVFIRGTSECPSFAEEDKSQ